MGIKRLAMKNETLILPLGNYLLFETTFPFKAFTLKIAIFQNFPTHGLRLIKHLSEPLNAIVVKFLLYFHIMQDLELNDLGL